MRVISLQHWVKNVQMRGFFWSVFSCIWTEYRKIRTRKNSVFGHFSPGATFVKRNFSQGFFPANVRFGEEDVFEDVFNAMFFSLPRRLQDVSKTSSKRVCKASWRRLKEGFLQTCLEDVQIIKQHFILNVHWNKNEI